MSIPVFDFLVVNLAQKPLGYRWDSLKNTHALSNKIVDFCVFIVEVSFFFTINIYHHYHSFITRRAAIRGASVTGAQLSAPLETLGREVYNWPSIMPRGKGISECDQNSSQVRSCICVSVEIHNFFFRNIDFSKHSFVAAIDKNSKDLII